MAMLTVRWVGLADLYPRLWDLVEATADANPSPSERALHKTWIRVLGAGTPIDELNR